MSLALNVRLVSVEGDIVILTEFSSSVSPRVLTVQAHAHAAFQALRDFLPTVTIYGSVGARVASGRMEHYRGEHEGRGAAPPLPISVLSLCVTKVTLLGGIPVSFWFFFTSGTEARPLTCTVNHPGSCDDAL